MRELPASGDPTGAPPVPVERSPVDLRLVPAVLAAWPAAWWSTGQVPAAGAVLSVLLLAPALLCAAAACGLLPGRRTRVEVAFGSRPARGTLAVVVLAATGAVAGSAAATGAVRSAGPVATLASAGAVVDLQARATGDAQLLAPGPYGGADRYAVRVQATRVDGRGSEAEVATPVVVLGGPAWSEVTAGEHLRLTGRLRPAEPGDDVVALVSAHGGPRDVRPGAWPWRVADRFREGLRTACRGLDRDAGGLLPSLVVGDTSMLPPTLREHLRTAGLAHLTAVSGANVAIVCGSVLWIAAAGGVARRPRLLLAAAVLVAFVVLARPQPSVLRAAAMGAVGLAGLAAARRPRGVPVLCGAVLALLVIDPWLSRSPGFVLSVVATAALLLLAPVWTDRLARYLPRPLALAVAAPAAAQAACGPVVVLLQPAVSTVAVPANLLAEPAVAPATVLGLVAALVSVAWPWGAHAVASVAAVATGWISAVAHTAAAVPVAELPWLPGPAGAAVLLAVTAVPVWWSVRPHPHGPEARSPRSRPPSAPSARSAPSRGPGALRRPGVPPQRRRGALAAGVAAVTAVVAGWVAAAALPLGAGSGSWPPAGWSVAMCDVGQGDSTALRSGADRAVLVDTGADPALVDACLRRLGVAHLDLVVLTHFHADHVGGLAGALAGRDARAVLVSPLQRPAGTAAAVMREAAAHRRPVGVAHVGGAGRVGSGGWRVDWRVLTAGTAGAAGPEEEGGTVVNEASIALDVTVHGPGGTVRIVLLGDLETEGQQALAGRLAAGLERLDGPVDVVKVAHHGSAKQSEDLYRRIGARVGLVGVGAGNDYGHPAPGALALLRRTGTDALRTDLSGHLAVQPGREGALVLTTSR